MPLSKTTLLHLLSPEEEQNAATALGREHPLARSLALERTRAFQLVATSIPMLLGIAGLFRHVGQARVVLGSATLVELALVTAIVLVRVQSRDHASELIAAGRESVPLRVVARERELLASRAERERLAAALERHLRDIGHWRYLFPASRPLPGVRCLRFTTGEARNVIALLRSDRSHVRGVAAARHLLTNGGSSLFGGDVELLRAELIRIGSLLETADSANAERVAA
jgi:hypothetical protein